MKSIEHRGLEKMERELQRMKLWGSWSQLGGKVLFRGSLIGSLLFLAYAVVLGEPQALLPILPLLLLALPLAWGMSTYSEWTRKKYVEYRRYHDETLTLLQGDPSLDEIHQKP